MDFLFNWEDIISFIFSFKPLLLLERDQDFKKILFLLMETVFFNFFRHWFKWKQSFGPLKLHFSTNPSFWLVETVLVHYKPFTFIQSFFLLVDTIYKTKLLVETIFLNFCRFSVSGSSFFRLMKTDFLLNAIHSNEWKRIFFIVFFYSEQILS